MIFFFFNFSTYVREKQIYTLKVPYSTHLEIFIFFIQNSDGAASRDLFYKNLDRSPENGLFSRLFTASFAQF